MKKFIVITILAAGFCISGCDPNSQQISADENVPVTEAIYAVENAPQDQQPEKPKSVEPRPLSSVSKAALKPETPAKRQKDAAHSSLIDAENTGQVLNLSEMKPVDSQEQTINAISDEIESDEQDNSINKPDQQPLAPYPSPVAADVDDYEDDWIEDAPDSTAMPEPIDGATVNPQDEANPLSAPEEDDKKPWQAQDADPALTKDADRLAREDVREIKTGKRIRRRRENVVPGKMQVVAGNSIQVNADYISPDEILAGLHQQLADIPKNITEEAFRKKAKETIHNEVMYEIQQYLIYQQAQKYLEDQAKKMIDEEMGKAREEMRNIAGGSMQKLRAQCISEGTTLEDILDTQKRDMMVQTYLQSKFIPAIVITRSMLWDYYRKNKSKYVSPTRVQMQLIAVPFAAFLPDSTEENPTDEELAVAKRDARSYIDKVYMRLISGGDFDRIAMEESKGPRASSGGVWPTMGKGNFRLKKVEEAAFSLPQGRFSQVIEDDKGYYIVKARRTYPGKVVSFEQAQEGVPDPGNPRNSLPPIEDILRREQFLKLRQQYMMDIYQKATINVPDNFYDYTTDLAIQRYYKK